MAEQNDVLSRSIVESTVWENTVLHLSSNASTNYFNPGFRRRWQIGHTNPWSYYVVREIITNFNYVI